jgi:hypothetical protein
MGIYWGPKPVKATKFQNTKSLNPCLTVCVCVCVKNEIVNFDFMNILTIPTCVFFDGVQHGVVIFRFYHDLMVHGVFMCL